MTRELDVNFAPSYAFSDQDMNKGLRVMDLQFPGDFDPFRIVEEKSLPQGFDTWYARASLDQREVVVDMLFGAYAESSDQVFDEFSLFNEVIEESFIDPTEQHLVKKSWKLATVAHQFNRYVDARARKSDESPYIFHPMAMAKRHMYEGYDMLVVMLDLLHDVPEDVDLRDIPDYTKKQKNSIPSPESLPGLAGSSAWLKIIKNEFNESSHDEQGQPMQVGRKYNRRLIGDLLSELVDGTSEKGNPEGPALRRVLRQTPFYKMVEKYVKDSTGKGLSEEDNEQLIKMVYNLEQLFDRGLASVDHMRIFITKTADVWHNFQSPEYIRLVKVLRGRVAASLAEWFGDYKMRSDLIESLAQITDTTTPYKPASTILESPNPEDVEYIDSLHSFMPGILDILKYAIHQDQEVDRLEEAQVSIGWSIPNTDNHYQNHWNDTNLPLPEILVLMHRYDILPLRLRQEKSKYPFTIVSDHPQLYPSGRPQAKHYNHYSETQHLVNRLIRRQRLDFTTKIGKQTGFKLRLQDNQPFIKDLFMRDSQIFADQVPELALFNSVLRRRLGNSEQREAWNFHVRNLIAFLYEPGLPVMLGNNLRPMYVDGGYIIFADAKHSLRRIFEFMDMKVNSQEREVRRMFARPYRINTLRPLEKQTGRLRLNIRDRFMMLIP